MVRIHFKNLLQLERIFSLTFLVKLVDRPLCRLIAWPINLD
jgi:hypothetical protein